MKIILDDEASKYISEHWFDKDGYIKAIYLDSKSDQLLNAVDNLITDLLIKEKMGMSDYTVNFNPDGGLISMDKEREGMDEKINL